MTGTTFKGSGRRQQRRRARHCERRGATLFVAVLGTALIVSLLALTGLTVVRIERRQANDVLALIEARANARSAVDLALAQLSNSNDWRTTYSAGTESTLQTLGAGADGTCSWSLVDEDGSFNDVDTKLLLSGIGRLADTVQVASVEVNLGQDAQLQSFEDDSTTSDDEVLLNKLWGQYFQPSVPIGVNRWKVTAVELMCNRGMEDVVFFIGLVEPDSGNLPGSNTWESTTLNSSDAGNSMVWQSFAMPGEHVFSAGDAVCLTVVTSESSGAPLNLRYCSGGAGLSNSGLLTGANGTWASYDSDKSLLFRVHGVYLYDYGDLRTVAGSWTWEAAP